MMPERPAPVPRHAAKKIRVPDGQICLNAKGDLAVTKMAVEPVGASELPVVPSH